MGRCRYFKSVSVFRYTARYFSSRFGICCRFFNISRYRFGIFISHFAPKRHACGS